MNFPRPARVLTGVVGVLLVGTASTYFLLPRDDHPTPPTFLPPPTDEATHEQVQHFCGTACHVYPPPDSFPRSAWRKEVEQGFYFAGRFRPDLRGPSLNSIVAYYESRAPVELPLPSRPSDRAGSTISWKRQGHPIPGHESFPEVVNVTPARLTPGGQLQLIVCECDPLKSEGRVLLFNPHANPPSWKELAKVPAPAHAEVVDLDGDGQMDILVACLGKFFPTDEKVGSVVWLRGKGSESFEPITLLRDVGRVADVQAVDVNGDGKLELIVAEFGWREIGSILLLENRSPTWTNPKIESRTLDDRHGTINICVGDLNGDRVPDFVAVISQEHETVVAFLNDGKGNFRKETIYTAPHPAYGSSGIQLVDLDGDGDLDVLYTNGDVLDKPFLLKPYHGVHWLENRGTFPFTHHRLADMPGVMRAVAADVRGQGVLDVFAVSYLPAEEFSRRDELDLDSVLWLEQTSKGNFVRRPLETKTCDHFTCAAADLAGNGRPSLVVGGFWSTKATRVSDAITIWSFPPATK